MRDGTKFSTWKDFALAVMDEMDATRDEADTLREEFDTLKDEFKEFKTRTYTVIAIIILIVGTLEIAVRI